MLEYFASSIDTRPIVITFLPIDEYLVRNPHLRRLRLLLPRLTTMVTTTDRPADETATVTARLRESENSHHQSRLLLSFLLLANVLRVRVRVPFVVAVVVGSDYYR